jgi:radical SAM protein with 4Fe4S-binding SPASM domain
MPGNNLGYFGPEEALLRSQNPNHFDHFQGCQAGKFVLGIESNGAVKGCPSLQPVYISGNIKQTPLQEQWDHSPVLGFSRTRTVDDLSGYCKQCGFAEICLGGCSFTAHAFLGKTGNQPYCHYRALQLKKQGIRERVIPIQSAQGLPFDHGLFEIMSEDFNAPLNEPKSDISMLKTTTSLLVQIKN